MTVIYYVEMDPGLYTASDIQLQTSRHPSEGHREREDQRLFPPSSGSSV